LSPLNTDSLNKIEGALAILVLDQNEYSSDSDMFKNMLCGNSHNRWYDKSIQLILSKNGHFAINYEHSGVDGTTLGNLVRFIYKNTKAYEKNKTGNPVHSTEEINFILDQDIEMEIVKAKAESNRVCFDNFHCLCGKSHKRQFQGSHGKTYRANKRMQEGIWSRPAYVWP